jgi:glucose/arabinose dehydrogenase
MKHVILSAGLALALLVPGAYAVAQDAAQKAPAATPAPAAKTYTDAQVKAFAQAAVKVQIIQEQARDQMMQVVAGTKDLGLDLYNEIVRTAQADPTLSNRISQSMVAYFKDAGLDQGAPAAGAQPQQKPAGK